MAKNPWMSAYLSAANKTANRAYAMTKTETTHAVKNAQNLSTDFWMDMMFPGAGSSKKSGGRKTTRRRKRR